MKAYCGKCVHVGEHFAEEDFECDHPLNIIDDFYGRNRVHDRTAADLNQFNDCPGFERKEK